MTPFALPVNSRITEALPGADCRDTAMVDNRVMTTDHHTERGVVMTTHTGQTHHHYSIRTVILAFAGAVLAAGAGYGAVNLVLDDAPAPITERDDSGVNPGNTNIDPNRSPGIQQ